MVAIDEFRKFLNRFRCEKGQVCTHTSIDQPKCRVNIPDDKMEEFYRIYQHALISSVPLHLTEKPAPISPLRVDLDFRFVMPTTPIVRQYDANTINSIVKAYHEILTNYVSDNEEGTRFDAYVMEKPAPTEYRGKVKDGIHIIYPNLCCSFAFQHLVRRQILEKATSIFNLPLCNSFEDVVDEAIIEHNNWQMYGSCKPGCAIYKITGVYAVDANGTIIERDRLLPDQELGCVSLLSMRKPSVAAPYLAAKQAEVDEYTKFVLPSIDNRRKNKLHAQIFGKSRNNASNHVTEDDRRLARQLVVECLKADRAERYEDWIKVGWCLRNIDCDLLDTFVDFSQMSSKYVEGECQQIWQKMQVGTIGMGSLKWWARQDNIFRYNEIINNNALALIDRCIGSNGAHFDMAKVVHALFKDKYCYATCDTWYVYDENRHRWVRTREGVKLRTILSCDVCEKVIERAQYWNRQASNMDDGIERENCDGKFKKLLKIAEQLKTSGYKDSVMKECKCVFTDERFEEKLDSNPSLLGFENGVYDLRLHEFRDGSPDDYISYGTNRYYFPFNPDSIEAKEIEDFLAQVFTTECVRKFVKDVLASVIDGGVRHEKFYVLTGSGSNSKSKLIDLFQQAIGDYYCILPIALLTQKRAASNAAQSELERTKGRRFAVMSEPGNNETLNIGLMKELTGGDRIQARALFKEPIEFKPQFKMFLICNDLPDVPSDDGGTWRRISVVEFKSKFVDNPNPTKKNEFLVDTTIMDKFEGWADTFISMLIAHHNTIDTKNIHEPMEVRIATQGYKNNNDIIGQFTNEMLVKLDDNSVKLQLNTIYADFRIWYKRFAPQGKKLPDRIQIRAYLENLYGAYPTGGWRSLAIKRLTEEEE